EVPLAARLGELRAGLSLDGGAVLEEERAKPAERIASRLSLRESPQALADAGRVLEGLGDLQRLRVLPVREEGLVAVLDRLRAGSQPDEARRPRARAQRPRVQAGHALEQLLRLGRISRALPGLRRLEEKARTAVGRSELRGLGERGRGLGQLAR